MKILAYSLFTITCLLCLAGCNTEIDNWSYPSSEISGRFLYNDQPVYIKATVTESVVDNMLQLNQTGPLDYVPGFIKMNARDDGSYSILTFDGDYEMTITPGRGPWQPLRDTLRFNLAGRKTNLDFHVTPYFWISNYQTTFADSVFTATFDLEQVVPTARLGRVVVYLGTTRIIDNVSRTVERSFSTDNMGPRTVSVDLRTLNANEKENLRRTGMLFARVGVQAAGVADLLFSQTTQLK